MSGNTTTIISWVGISDIKCMEAGDSAPQKVGPVRTITDNIAADRIFLLLSREMEKNADNFEAWVRRGITKECELSLEKTDLDDPSSYQKVYDATERFFAKHQITRNNASLIFILSPGTATMESVLLYFSHVRYPESKVYQTLDPRKVPEGPWYREVYLPFKLSSVSWTSEPSDSLPEDELSFIMETYAPSPLVNILLLGETGVGKSYWAKEIHKVSGQKKDFISVNCAVAMGGEIEFLRSELFGHCKGAYTGAEKDRKGAFELAKGGTLFLDEIGEVPLSLQPTLLTALEERKITPLGSDKSIDVSDVRIISATNKDLRKEVEQGRFRADLYSRIAMLPVNLPPLRDIARNSPETFAAIVKESLKKVSQDVKRDLTLEEDALDLLMTYRFPGNRRQLKHILLLAGIEASVKASSTITKNYLQRHLKGTWASQTSIGEKQSVSLMDIFSDIKFQELPKNLENWIENIRSTIIDEALRRCGNKVSKASKMLGMTYQKLDYFLKNKGKK